MNIIRGNKKRIHEALVNLGSVVVHLHVHTARKCVVDGIALDPGDSLDLRIVLNITQVNFTTPREQQMWAALMMAVEEGKLVLESGSTDPATLAIKKGKAT